MILSTSSFRKIGFVIGVMLAVVCADRLISIGITKLVVSGEFRYAKLYSSRWDADVLILGNSRALHSIYAPHINRDTCLTAANLAYNGLNMDAVDIILQDYIRYNSMPKFVILELSSMYGSEAGNAQLSIYRNISASLDKYFEQNTDSVVPWSKIFNLLSYNSEMLYRSFIYIGKDDQNWINRTSMSNKTVREDMKNRKPEQLVTEDQSIVKLKHILQLLNENGIKPILYIAPYHPDIANIYTNPYTWETDLMQLYGIHVFEDMDFRYSLQKAEYFSDYLHTNIYGATFITEKISKYINQLACGTF